MTLFKLNGIKTPRFNRIFLLPSARPRSYDTLAKPVLIFPINSSANVFPITLKT